MKTVVLISCVANKRKDSEYPACDLYLGPLFKNSFEYAKNLKPDMIHILSAKHHLIKYNEKISDYNLTYMIQNKYLHHPKCFATLKVDLSKIGILAADYNQTDLDKEFNNIQNISKLVESTKDIIKERKAVS